MILEKMTINFLRYYNTFCFIFIISFYIYTNICHLFIISINFIKINRITIYLLQLRFFIPNFCILASKINPIRITYPRCNTPVTLGTSGKANTVRAVKRKKKAKRENPLAAFQEGARASVNMGTRTPPVPLARRVEERKARRNKEKRRCSSGLRMGWHKTNI